MKSPSDRGVEGLARLAKIGGTAASRPEVDGGSPNRETGPPTRQPRGRIEKSRAGVTGRDPIAVDEQRREPRSRANRRVADVFARGEGTAAWDRLGLGDTMQIRGYTDAGWPSVRPIFQEVVAAGETMAYDPGWSPEQAHEVSSKGASMKRT